MNELTSKLYKFINKIKKNRIVILIAFSFIILSFTFINIFDLFHFNIIYSSLFYETFLFFIALITISLFPAYPIFFLLLSKNKYTYLEKLAFSICTNLTFFILLGYLSNFLSLDFTKYFIFYGLIVSHIVIFITTLILRQYFRKDSINQSVKTANLEESILEYLKNNVSLNSLLLIIFIIMLCIFNVIRIKIFMGTDPWLHIFIVKFIAEKNYLPLDFYYDNLGFHIIGATIHYFSNINFLLLPNLFVFYTFPVSALILYCIFKRVFKNSNLAVLGTFILEFSFIGFSFMMYQYWPTSLAVIQGLTIFFILSIRQRRFIKQKNPDNKMIKEGMLQTYTLIILIFISSLLTHSLITIIMFISYIFIYIIYFIKNWRRGVDLLLMIFLASIFLAMYLIDFGTGHFDFLFYLYSLPPSYIVIALIFGSAFIIGIITFIVKSIDFKLNKYIPTILSKQFKKVEKRYIYPLITCIIVISSFVFIIGNLFYFHLNLTTISTVIQIVILVFLGVWGFILFQKKPKGKFLFIWLVGYLVLFGAAFFSFTFFGVFREYTRIFILSSVPIIIGFISYVYKLAKTKEINNFRAKALIISFIAFSIITTYMEEKSYFETFSLNNQELSNIKWYGDYSDDKNLLILEFGWEYPIIYYDYPYQNENVDPFRLFHYFFASEEYMNPDAHINQNGLNTLKLLKKNYGTDVYLILTDEFISLSGWESFGGLTKEQVKQYYNLSYLNRICSTKNINGIDEPIYWVL